MNEICCFHDTFLHNIFSNYKISLDAEIMKDHLYKMYVTQSNLFQFKPFIAAWLYL